MIKELKCQNCLEPLGEISKGKIKWGAVVLCKSCWPLLDNAAKYSQPIFDEIFGKR